MLFSEGQRRYGSEAHVDLTPLILPGGHSVCDTGVMILRSAWSPGQRVPLVLLGRSGPPARKPHGRLTAGSRQAHRADRPGRRAAPCTSRCPRPRSATRRRRPSSDPGTPRRVDARRGTTGPCYRTRCTEGCLASEPIQRRHPWRHRRSAERQLSRTPPKSQRATRTTATATAIKT